MKTAINILAPFNEPPIPGRVHHSIRSWKSESSETFTGIISGNFLNHHQYKISHDTPSIIVANGVANSVSFTKSFAYNNPEIECRFTHSFQRLNRSGDFEKLMLWMHCNHAVESYGRNARKEKRQYY